MDLRQRIKEWEKSKEKWLSMAKECGVDIEKVNKAFELGELEMVRDEALLVAKAVKVDKRLVNERFDLERAAIIARYAKEAE